jgi:hypothetical protein
MCVCFDLLFKFCLKHLSFEEELSEILSKMYIDLQMDRHYEAHTSYRNNQQDANVY